MDINIQEETIAEVKQIMTRLALGLIRQDGAIRKGIAVPATQLDEQLQGGWDQLTALCYTYGVSPPRHLPQLVEWLHKPVETWDTLGAIAVRADLSGTLLSYGEPSEYCYELSRDMQLASDPERELQDVPFKEILSYCKNNRLVEQYQRARAFLVNNPFLPYGVITITSDPLWNDEIRKWLRRCYEPIPLSCHRQINGQTVIACCPRCHWPLEWRSKKTHLARCYNDLCSRLIKNIHNPSLWLDVAPESLRTTRGIQASVVAPEIPLLALTNRIQQKLGLVCELWPEVDNYDLLISTSHGERWAVDMKDHLNPRRLADAARTFAPVPDWDQAFYVFPEYRRRSGYFRAFMTSWYSPPRTQAFFVDDFFSRLRDHEKNGGSTHA